MKEIKTIEQYDELIEEAKQAGVDIIVNGKKMDKRKNLVENMDDVFDNNVAVRFCFFKNRLNISIGGRASKF